MQVAVFTDALAYYAVEPLKSPKRIAIDAPRPRVPISQFPNLRRLAREHLRLQRSRRHGELTEGALRGEGRVAALADLRAEMTPLIGSQGGSSSREELPLPNWATRDSNYPDQEVPTAEIPVDELQAAAKAMTQAEPPGDLGIRRASAQSLAPATTPARRARPGRGPMASRPLRWVIQLGGVIVVGLGIGWLLMTRTESLRTQSPVEPRSSEAATPVATPLELASKELHELREVRDAGATGQASHPTQAADTRTERGPTVCRRSGESVRLDSWAVPSVPPLLLDEPNSPQVAIGYARSRENARGLRLDPETLAFQDVFRQGPRGGAGAKRYIYSVVPNASAGAMSFEVERLDPDMAFGLALPTTPILRLGMNNGGIEVGPLGRRGKRIWELPSLAIITLPSLATTGDGIMVTMRVGRGTASVRSGLLNLQGEPQSELVALHSPPGGRLGRPVIAAGKNNTALAVVFRRKGENDQLLLASAPIGMLPEAARAFEGVELDPTLAAPVLTALRGGGYALGWTEGKKWRRRVRLIKLSAELEPLTPAADITIPDENYRGSTTAALHATKEANGLLLFHFLARRQGNALWVSKVDCNSKPNPFDEN
jgi:hypothetical protein